MYEIIIYKDRNGNSEIIDYLTELKEKSECNKDARVKLNKIVAYIRMLEKEGLNLGEPYIKHLEKEIWELRPLRDRILFAYLYKNKFVLLNQFMKQTQKTSKKEIKQAEKRLQDFKDRSDLL